MKNASKNISTWGDKKSLKYKSTWGKIPLIYGGIKNTFKNISTWGDKNTFKVQVHGGTKIL